MPRVPSAPAGQGTPSKDNGKLRSFSGSRSGGGDDAILGDTFDYIGAYVDSGSPQLGSDYGSGKFAANLENK